MLIDTNTEFGARVARRLREEQVIWLTTVAPDGSPQPNPVWFLWEQDSETILIYTTPKAVKVRNLTQNPRVSLHFNSDEWGGDVVIFSGEARIVSDGLPVDQVAAYVEKYRAGMADINLTPESMAKEYSVVIRVKVTKVRGF